MPPALREVVMWDPYIGACVPAWRVLHADPYVAIRVLKIFHSRWTAQTWVQGVVILPGFE